MTLVAVLADERLVSLDRKVDAAEGDGILARWEFGRELLAERVGKLLPRGRLDEVSTTIGKSRQEIQRRMFVAEKFPTEVELSHAVRQFGSWHGFWNSPHVSNNSGNNEWYTPPAFIEAARATMGGIDLDPASSATAQETVQAAAYFTAEDDGLTYDWAGNIWLNPPYAAKLIGQFIEKLTTEDLVDQACVLVNNGTETQWGQSLLGAASAVCFPQARVKFLHPEGNTGAPLQGQMVAYIGEHPKRFVREFEPFGRVLIHG